MKNEIKSFPLSESVNVSCFIFMIKAASSDGWGLADVHMWKCA